MLSLSTFHTVCGEKFNPVAVVVDEDGGGLWESTRLPVSSGRIRSVRETIIKFSDTLIRTEVCKHDNRLRTQRGHLVVRNRTNSVCLHSAVEIWLANVIQQERVVRVFLFTNHAFPFQKTHHLKKAAPDALC